MCEVLIECGHNTEFRNPYQYPFRMLVAVSRKFRERRKNEYLGSVFANHISRIACVSGDDKVFNEHISKITEE